MQAPEEEASLKRQRLLKDSAIGHKRSQLNARHLQLLSIPMPMLVPLQLPFTFQNEQQPLKLSTPLEKLRRIRQRMSRETSLKTKQADSYSIKAYTLELRDQGEKPDDCNRNVEGPFNGRASQQELAGGSQSHLLAKYLSHMRQKGHSSLDRRSESVGRAKSKSRSWLQSNMVKHSFVEKLSRQRSKRKAEVRQSESPPLFSKDDRYRMKFVEQRADSPIRVVSGMPLKQPPAGKSNSRRQTFKQFKQSRLAAEQPHMQLRPWEAAKDDYYNFD